MNRSNYALITALYDTKGADLYNDVYFPIINYGIVTQYYAQNKIERYYDLAELQQLIISDFGVKIPLIILRQSIRAIGNGENGVSLSIYEKGKQYKIQKAWDISIKVSIDNKSQEISSKFSKLEILYKSFLEIEQIPFEKSLTEFYSEHTEEILNYIDKADGSAIIDEKYVNLTRFLSWLEKNNTELFNIANDIFWGSVVAAFLKRDTAEINIKSSEKIEYYLDSSLVLSILGLDNIDNVNYGKELLEIIKSSGNKARVHSLTIREISHILNSVEKEQGPRPNSAIEEAYYRLDLSPRKVMMMNNKLSDIIEKEGIIILKATKNELDEIEIKYKNKHSVKALEKSRYTNNNNSIRDVHDVFLQEFVQKKQKNIVSIEKANSFFVTLNTDLISYYKNKNTIPTVIHPAKIVTDLWIHNSSSSFVKKKGLSEIMSRCFALNNTDIRRKLKLVSKYYKETEEEYSEENYRMVYNSLINRSTKALKEIKSISLNEEDNPEHKHEINTAHVKALIRIAIEEENEKKQKNSYLTSKLEKLSENIESKEYQLSQLNNLNKTDKEKINQLKAEIGIQKEITIVSDEINIISNEISQLESLKQKSVSNSKYYAIICLEILAILGVIVFLFLLIYTYNDGTTNFLDYVKKSLGLILGFFITALGLVIRLQKLYLFSPKINFEKNKEEQINYWIKKNPKYNELKGKLVDLQTQKAKLFL